MQSSFNLTTRKEKNKIQKAAACQFVTNYYAVSNSGKDSVVQQYVVSADPQLPADSTDLIKEAIFSAKRILHNDIGYISSSGWMLWANKKVNAARSIPVKFFFNGVQNSFNLIIKPNKEVSLQEIGNDPKRIHEYKQILNIRLKQKLKKLGMSELVPGKYFYDNPKQDFLLDRYNLRVLRGYNVTLAVINNRMLAQVDVCSRVCRISSLLDDLQTNRNTKDDLENLIGKTIITRYGKRKTYKIAGFNQKLNPNSEFYHSKSNGKITYAKYYQENYGVEIRDKRQPLLAITQQKKKLQNGIFVKTNETIYLIPELVSLTGMSDDMKKDYQIMKELAPTTKLEPNQRLQITEELIRQLNGDTPIIGKGHKVQGILLPSPIIQLKQGKITSQRGNINIKDILCNAKQIKQWVFMYSYGRQPKYDDNDADSALDLIYRSQKVFGIDLNQPQFICVQGKKPEDWLQALRNTIDPKKKPQIILFFLHKYQQKHYEAIKRFLTCELNIVSQCVQRRTLSNKAKNAMSAASKLLIQMVTKIGGAPWLVQSQNLYLRNKNFMYGGISFSKGKKGYTMSFVGTTDITLTSCFSFSKVRLPTKESVSEEIFYKMFLDWFKAYYYKNGKKILPTEIIIYRDGLSTEQIKSQFPTQIKALKNAIKKTEQNTKTANYDPKIIYNFTNKKIGTKFFIEDRGNHSGKGQLSIKNPLPGSAIGQGLSVEGMNDFHFVAQQVTQGTCNPTHYIQALNQSSMSQLDLMQFTNQQCYSYFNWTGAVRVPAMLQAAGKLAKLTGEFIDRDIDKQEIQQKAFFY